MQGLGGANESPRGEGAEWDRDGQLEVQWCPAPKNELPVKTVSV